MVAKKKNCSESSSSFADLEPKKIPLTRRRGDLTALGARRILAHYKANTYETLSMLERNSFSLAVVLVGYSLGLMFALYFARPTIEARALLILLASASLFGALVALWISRFERRVRLVVEAAARKAEEELEEEEEEEEELVEEELPVVAGVASYDELDACKECGNLDLIYGEDSSLCTECGLTNTTQRHREEDLVLPTCDNCNQPAVILVMNGRMCLACGEATKRTN